MTGQTEKSSTSWRQKKQTAPKKEHPRGSSGSAPTNPASDKSPTTTTKTTTRRQNRLLRRLVGLSFLFVGILIYEFADSSDQQSILALPGFWITILSTAAFGVVGTALWALYHRSRRHRLRPQRAAAPHQDSGWCTRDRRRHHTAPHTDQRTNTTPLPPLQKQLRTILSLTKPYLLSSHRPTVLLLILSLTLGLNSALSVLSSYAHKNFYNALDSRDVADFRRAMIEYALVILSYAPVKGLYEWRLGVTSLDWRSWLTAHALDLYGTDRVYYRLERIRGGSAGGGGGGGGTGFGAVDDVGKASGGGDMLEDDDEMTTDCTVDTYSSSSDDTQARRPSTTKKPTTTPISSSSTTTPAHEIDNPDQRLTEDITSFTKYVLHLAVHIVKNTISLISFSIILYTIAPHLFPIIIVYVVVGTAVALACGARPLTVANRDSLKAEADLRFELVRLRENAESIAFYDTSSSNNNNNNTSNPYHPSPTESYERKSINHRMTEVVSTRLRILWIQLRLEFFTNLYFYTTWVLPVALVAPAYFRGELELGQVMQCREAFYHVVSDVSLIVRELESVSAFLAGVWRLGSFYKVMGELLEESSRRNDRSGWDGGDDGLLGGCLGRIDKKKKRFCNVIGGGGDDNGHWDEEQQQPNTATKQSLSNTKHQPQTDNDIGAIQIRPLPQTARIYPVSQSSSSSALPTPPPIVLRITNLTLSIPTHGTSSSSTQNRQRRTLIRNLNLTIREGRNLLIAGRSGSGKSSLLRCIAGLWDSGFGTVERPMGDCRYRRDDGDGDGGANGNEDGGGVYFLPQKPYCPVGSLRDQLLYPSCLMNSFFDDHRDDDDDDNGVVGDGTEDGEISFDDDFVTNPSCDSCTSPTKPSNNNNNNNNNNNSRSQTPPQPTDEELLSILDLVQLPNLASNVGRGDPLLGLSVVEDWTNMLSLGEQQRLAFARVFIHRPRLVVMDEATSALDLVLQDRMYRILVRMGASSGYGGSDGGGLEGKGGGGGGGGGGILRSFLGGNSVSSNYGNAEMTMLPIEGGGKRKTVPFRPIKGGLTFVSVGHRPSLLTYHDTKLLLHDKYDGDVGDTGDGGGGYEINDIDHSKADRIATASMDLLFSE